MPAYKPFIAKRFLQEKLPELATKASSRANSLANLSKRNRDSRLLSLIRKLKEQIRNHPVSKELEEGPYAENSVAIISTADEVGNLFSFIGFDSEAQPVESLIDFIDSFIKIPNNTPQVNISRNRLMIRYTWQVQIPTKEDFDDEESLQYPDGYQSGSWVNGIEDGIMGIGSYLFDSDRDFGETSRSGPAIQAKTKSGALINIGTRQQVQIRNGYMSKLLKQFAKELNKR